MTTTISGTEGVDKVKPNSVDKDDLKWVPPFTKEYVSPEQTIVAASVITLTHLLGEAPKLVTYSLICKVADLGYAIGDEVDGQNDSTSNTYNFGGGRNSTTIRAICGASGIVAVSTAGVLTPVTLANWRLIVRAWA